jgi:hypothetical protein
VFNVRLTPASGVGVESWTLPQPTRDLKVAPQNVDGRSIGSPAVRRLRRVPSGRAFVKNRGQRQESLANYLQAGF